MRRALRGVRGWDPLPGGGRRRVWGRGGGPVRVRPGGGVRAWGRCPSPGCAEVRRGHGTGSSVWRCGSAEGGASGGRERLVAQEGLS